MSKLSFRWYGPDDPVPLSYIRQIPNMHSVVSAVYDVPPGEVWSDESIEAIAQAARDNGLGLELILKDISTVRYEPQRLWTWSRIALEEVSR